MEKRVLRYGTKLNICYLVEKDRFPELHLFLKQLKENDLSTFKKALKFIDKLKDIPESFRAQQKFKKLKGHENLWELVISKSTRFFLFYLSTDEICITHGYTKQSKNDKRLQNEIAKAENMKMRYYGQE